MERSKALMTPMTADSFESSGFGVIATSAPSPRISNSITTCIIDTASSRERHLSRSFTKSSFSQTSCLRDLSYLNFLTFPMEISLLFDLSEVTRCWMSSEKSSSCQGISFTPTFVPELSLLYIKSKFTRGRSWFSVCPTSSPPQLLLLSHRLGYPCADTS